MSRVLEKQVVVRMPAELVDALERDAEANERTLAATVRYWLRRGLESNHTHGISGDASATMGPSRRSPVAATETPPPLADTSAGAWTESDSDMPDSSPAGCG